MLSSTSSSEPPKSRHAKASLVGFAGALVLTLLGVFAVSEWLVRTQVLPQDTAQLHLNLLATAESGDAAFGDSHVARGFDAPEGMVNLAFPSENIRDMIRKANGYYNDRAPGLVIVQADPHQFSPYRMRAAPSQIVTDARSGLAILQRRHRWRLLDYWYAFVRDGGKLRSKVRMTKQGALLSEGDFSDKPARLQALEARQRLATHRLGAAAEMQSTQMAYSAFLDTLAEKGAGLCLVAFPVTPAYLAAENGLHDPAIEFYAAEAKRTGARFVDARRAVVDPALFRDVDHLNVEGAKLFSTWLLEACTDAE